MFKIISEWSKEDSEKVIAKRTDPNSSYRGHMFNDGESYYLKIKITDKIVAEQFLICLLNTPSLGIEGAEKLGFTLSEIRWDNLNTNDNVVRILSDFINNELPDRLKASQI